MIDRIFFDSRGNQVNPDEAVSCHELEMDDNGAVIAERNYTLKGMDGIQFNPDGLKKPN